LNWKHLPNDRKALYTVVNDEGLTAQPAKNFTPPELLPKTDEENKEATGDDVKKEGAEADVLKDKPAVTGADETQEQQVVRLFTIAAPKTDEEKKEVIKSIAKDVAAHFKTVEKIVNAYLKK